MAQRCQGEKSMNIDTTTRITQKCLGSRQRELAINVRHDNDYEYGFEVTFACQIEMFTSSDLRVMVKCFNKALRIRRAAAK